MPQDPFDLAQLGVGVLQRHRPLDDQLDVDAVADGHLVDEAAEVPLLLGYSGDELLAAALEIDNGLFAPGVLIRRTAPSNSPLLLHPATPGSQSPPSCCSGGGDLHPRRGFEDFFGRLAGAAVAG